MKIFKSGKRTGIQAGDLVVIYIDNPKVGLLLSVGRGISNQLRFEGTNNDDKQIVEGYSVDASGADQLVMFIGQITGLQAKLVNKGEGFITYEMEVGKSLLAQI